MPPSVRRALIWIGLLLALLALAALIYALLPIPDLTGTYPVAPTLLAPPGGGP